MTPAPEADCQGAGGQHKVQKQKMKVIIGEPIGKRRRHHYHR
jgi:hypothetical protein